ncbi:hypothetical protein EG359_11325 [Chryseobacterium joostei]|uniref:Integrase catalytic domain-containing protein n=1 Tax=Chryseobacterium joostei TaxID=112234 RepID=A0ABM7BLQ5_9FLAO|nr:hypothetical protein EG347_10730 [Chryseobacterium sp. G0186]AZB00177.1 hypothetical protein EG359_11325 [Chryseobacterium joostei]
MLPKSGIKPTLFTAIDDCTRIKVIRIYFNKNAESIIQFLNAILDTFYFPINHIQTDLGIKFFNYPPSNKF